MSPGRSASPGSPRASDPPAPPPPPPPPPDDPGSRRAQHLAPRHDRRRLIVVLGVAAVVITAAIGIQRLTADDDSSDPAEDEAATEDEGTGAAPQTTGSTAPTVTTQPPPPRSASGFATPGLLTFRGSASRSFYGEGPVPRAPRVLWSYPGASGGLCAESTVGSETKTWCGSGWTGQPAVFDRAGRTWVVFGAYDRNVHFVDYTTGTDIIPPFPTGDIIKGSVTVDPDGFPLVYHGSRDNKLRILAIDGPEPREMWSLDATAVSPTKWNNDWDGTPLVIDDYLYEGGENSQFHVVKLNRGYAPDGSVTLAPELVFNTPGWDDELTASLESRAGDVSIEGSVAYRDGVVYFANSGGLVQGWDVSGLPQGVPPSRVFRFWTGDDTDASVVIDDEGFLYVAVENDRHTARGAEVGQLLKLDPRQPDNPIVWSFHDPTGFWATPGLHKDLVIAPADSGTTFALDRATGALRWSVDLPGPTWQSPVIVDNIWIQGDCNGILHGFDVTNTAIRPPELWKLEIGGCIESTPAVWKGRMFVGTRGGRFFAMGD